MFAILSHATSTIDPPLNFARSLYTGLNLPDRLREVTILTLAEATTASFVWSQHTPISAAAGRAVARFTAAVADGPTVSDELFGTLRAQLSEREIVELLQVLGYYWLLGRISTVLEIEPTEPYETYRDRFVAH